MIPIDVKKYGAYAAVFAVFAGSGFWTLNQRNEFRHRAIAESKARDVAITKATAIADYHLCIQINGVRTVLRTQENEDFRHLARNLKILHVPATARVIRIATHEHSEKLRRLRPRNCILGRTTN